MPQKEVVYNLLAVKKRAVALQKLSEELDTPMPNLFKTLKSLESEGLVELYYGKEKAQVMVRAKTIEDFML